MSFCHFNMVFIYYLYYYGDNVATKYYISDPAGLCCVTTELINNIDVGGCLIAAWSRADRGPGRQRPRPGCLCRLGSEVESGSGSLGKEVTPSSTYIRIVNAVGCFRRQPYIKIRAFDIYSFFFFVSQLHRRPSADMRQMGHQDVRKSCIG